MGRYRTINVNLDRGYRNDLNQNFSDIERDILKNQEDIKMVETETLKKVNEIVGGGFIESLETARDAANASATEANTQAAHAKTQGDHAKIQGDFAQAQGDYAKLKGDYADEKAILASQAAAHADQEASNLGQLKIDVVNATQAANTAAEAANQKASQAETAASNANDAALAANDVTANVQAIVDSTGYREEYNDLTEYKRNNVVSYRGSSYMAKQNTLGNLPTDNTFWGLIAEKGEQGTGLNILGSLNDESELPPTGDIGSAYLINGYLFVWDGTAWQNAGNIKGPKGDTGEPGPKGDTGEKGIPGVKGDPGERGLQGEQGIQGERGLQGDPGISAYEVAVQNGFSGTEAEWLVTLVGSKGEKGDKGDQGEKGDPGTTTWVGIQDKPITFPSTVEEVDGLQTSLDEKAPITHVEQKINEAETHGMRVNQDGKFEYFNGTDWVEVSGSGGGEVWEDIQTVDLWSTQTNTVDFRNLTPYKRLRLSINTCTITAASSLTITQNYNTTAGEYNGYRVFNGTNTSYSNGLVATINLGINTYINALFYIDFSANSVYLDGWISTGESSTGSQTNDRKSVYFHRGVFRYWPTPAIQVNLITASSKFNQGQMKLEGVRI